MVIINFINIGAHISSSGHSNNHCTLDRRLAIDNIRKYTSIIITLIKQHRIQHSMWISCWHAFSLCFIFCCCCCCFLVFCGVWCTFLYCLLKKCISPITMFFLIVSFDHINYGACMCSFFLSFTHIYSIHSYNFNCILVHTHTHTHGTYHINDVCIEIFCKF